ncbi:hypothetical protein VTK26DRAFT_5360 [Humicola hyalothermophila]
MPLFPRQLPTNSPSLSTPRGSQETSGKPSKKKKSSVPNSLNWEEKIHRPNEMFSCFARVAKINDDQGITGYTLTLVYPGAATTKTLTLSSARPPHPSFVTYLHDLVIGVWPARMPPANMLRHLVIA